MKFATKPIRHYPPHLRHVATLPREIKNSNFWTPVNCALSCNVFNSLVTPRFVQRFSGNASENLFDVYPSNTNFLSKSCPRHWIPCRLLTNTAVTSAVTNFWCHEVITKVNNQKNNKNDMKKLTCNQYGEWYPISWHRKYQNLWTNNKVRGY